MKTREELVTFCEATLSQAQDFVRQGGAAPVAFVINDEGMACIALDEIPSKDAWGFCIEAVKNKIHGHTVVMLMECWAVMGNMKEDTSAEYLRTVGTDEYVPPSEHPDRIEIVQVTTKSDKFDDYYQCIQILRESDGVHFKQIAELSSKPGNSDKMYCRFTDGDYTPEQKAAMN